ncbi:MAG TPA: hypothetical protein VFQ38_08265 [Longimicrobiales bacterium]|nr:hypothetical protein [Longimicrobiales bacterium]
MASLSSMDTSALEALRSRLESLEGAQRVLLDTAREEVWIIGRPDAGRLRLEGAAQDALLEAGFDPGSVGVAIIRQPGEPDRNRARFVGVTRSPAEDGRVRVRVTLEWQGQDFVGEEIAEPGLPMETRGAAIATVQAIARASNGELGLRLTGIKPVRAFDHEIMVASLYRVSGSRQQLIGAVLMGDDALRTACMAVLNALNRILGNYLNTAF